VSVTWIPCPRLGQKVFRRHVSAALKRLVMNLETAGMTIECDTSVDKNIASSLCTDLYDVLDEVENYDLDKDGSIAVLPNESRAETDVMLQ
jgi:hypothetical protein